MTSALNLAKSQLENASAQSYNKSIGDGNLSKVYGLITETGGNIVDKINYNISGRVENVNTSLQKITVNVSYLNGKKVQLIGYKEDAGNINITTPYRGMLVTDNIQNVPVLYSGSGGTDIACNPTFNGYYHVFNTSGGQVSITWDFNWIRWDDGSGSEVGVNPSMGAPMIAIYSGIPNWANRDYLGVPKIDGKIQRQQDNMNIYLLQYPIGALPGAFTGSGDTSCQCWCPDNCSGESAPEWFVPHDCLSRYNDYPCTGTCLSDDEYWYYDEPLGSCSYVVVCDMSGTLDRTFTTTLSAGTHTILFFNAENKIDIHTTTAAIVYPK
jgi:hypothetical protein